MSDRDAALESWRALASEAPDPFAAHVAAPPDGVARRTRGASGPWQDLPNGGRYRVVSPPSVGAVSGEQRSIHQDRLYDLVAWGVVEAGHPAEGELASLYAEACEKRRRSDVRSENDPPGQFSRIPTGVYVDDERHPIPTFREHVRTGPAFDPARDAELAAAAYFEVEARRQAPATAVPKDSGCRWVAPKNVALDRNDHDENDARAEASKAGRAKAARAIVRVAWLPSPAIVRARIGMRARLRRWGTAAAELVRGFDPDRETFGEHVFGKLPQPLAPIPITSPWAALELDRAHPDESPATPGPPDVSDWFAEVLDAEDAVARAIFRRRADKVAEARAARDRADAELMRWLDGWARAGDPAGLLAFVGAIRGRVQARRAAREAELRSLPADDSSRVAIARAMPGAARRGKFGPAGQIVAALDGAALKWKGEYLPRFRAAAAAGQHEIVAFDDAGGFTLADGFEATADQHEDAHRRQRRALSRGL